MWTKSPLRTTLPSILPAAVLLCAAPTIVPAQSQAPALEPAAAPMVQGIAGITSGTNAIDAARAAGDEALVRRLEASVARKAKPPGAESAGTTTRLPSTARFGSGTPLDPVVDGDSSLAMDDPYFGGDVFVRSSDLDHGEFHHAMASDSNGNLYIAFQDDYFAYDYVQLYKSSDGGLSWYAIGYVLDNDADIREPSIAVGEGGNGDTLLIAYIRDDGSGLPVPEVATKDLSTGGVTISSVPIWNWWDGYAKPVIVTDSVDWSTWYAYLTCEGIFDTGANNVNVCTWRSTDGGAIFKDEGVPFGDLDVYAWTDPDLGYGTTGMDHFLITYCKYDYTVHVAKSTDNTLTWTPGVISTLSLLPSAPVDPEVEAGHGVDTVMACWTGSGGATGGGDNILYSYSRNSGSTWTATYLIPWYSRADEFAPALIASEGGGNYHLAFASGQDHSVRYDYRPQHLNDSWSYDRIVIDDQGAAGTWDSRAKKAIACNWDTDVAYIGWADARDNNPGDTDTYVDFTGNVGLMIDRRLISSTANETVNFTLSAGAANAGRMHFLVCSMSGYEPGIPLPGGYVTLPINPDAITLYPLLIGAPMFTNFVSFLDSDGKSTAAFNVPANAGLVPGQEIHFAFALWKPWDFASNAVSVQVALF